MKLLVSVLFVAVSFFANNAFADHSTAEVQMGIGSSVPGCEETNECYVPYEVRVNVGGEVTWINEDTAAHTVTAGDLETDPTVTGENYQNGFDSGLFLSGSTFSHKFTETGTYPYFCAIHPWMTGVIIIQGDNEPYGNDDYAYTPSKNYDNYDQEARDEIEKLNAENDRLLSTISGLEGDIKVLEIENTNLQLEIDRLKTLIDDLNNKINDLNQTITEQIKVIYDYIVKQSR